MASAQISGLDAPNSLDCPRPARSSHARRCTAVVAPGPQTMLAVAGFFAALDSHRVRRSER